MLASRVCTLAANRTDVDGKCDVMMILTSAMKANKYVTSCIFTLVKAQRNPMLNTHDAVLHVQNTNGKFGPACQLCCEWESWIVLSSR